MNSSLTGRFLDRLQRNNPFYLISAACMLGGCLAVTNSLSWQSIPIGRLLTLIVTLNGYEAILIWLAVHLIRHGRARRDGMVLLALEAFFLVDVTFLNAEIATASLALGVGINLVLLAAAIVKLSIIVRAAGGKMADGRGAVIVVELAALFALPIVLRWMDHGSLSAGQFYAAWWVLALLIPLSDLLIRMLPVDRVAASGRMISFFAVLPWISIGGHLGIMHYVYGVQYFGADAAPVLLGLAIVMGRLNGGRFVGRQDLAVIRVLLPAAAIFVSSNDPWLLCGSVKGFAVTPTRLASAGAYLTYVYCFLAPYAIFLLSAGALVVVAMVFGPTTQQVGDKGIAGLYWLGKLARRLIPETQAGWGAVAIGGAFGFLGIGARLSLRKETVVEKT